MAEVTIRLRHNPRTGERVLVIHYESEADALPHEHERDHRALAERLIGRPLAELGVDRVLVEAGAGLGEKGVEDAPQRVAERERG